MPRLFTSYTQGKRPSEGRDAKGDSVALADPLAVSRAIATKPMLRCNMSSRNPCCSAQYRAFELEPAAPRPAPRHPRYASPRASALPHASAAHAGPASPARTVPRRIDRGEGEGIEIDGEAGPPRLGVLTRSVAEATGMSSRLARRRCRDV